MGVTACVDGNECMLHLHHDVSAYNTLAITLHPQARRLGIGLQVHFSSTSGSVGGPGGMGMQLHRRDLSTPCRAGVLGGLGVWCCCYRTWCGCSERALQGDWEGGLPTSGEFI